MVTGVITKHTKIWKTKKIWWFLEKNALSFLLKMMDTLRRGNGLFSGIVNDNRMFVVFRG